MILYTSNKNKQAEFKRLFGIYPITIKGGEEYPEVLGTIDEIIINKSLDMGDNSIVEDTTAIINGEQYTNMIETCKGDIKEGELFSEIKYRFIELKTDDKIKSISSLAVNRNGEILVFRGSMYGIIDRSLGNGELESFMTPILGKVTLSGTMEELRNKGYGDMISWRSIAVRKFLRYESIEKGASMTPFMYDSCQPDIRIKIKDIPKWTGEYQKD